MITGEIVQACTVEGCDRPVKAKGWCLRHYQKARIYGVPEGRDPVRERIEDVEWMVETEESPEAIAARCGVALPSLVRWLQARGEKTLADALTAERPGRLPVGVLRGPDRG